MGDARNTDGLLPKDMVGKLGLDYDNVTYMKDGTPVEELFYVDMPITDELRGSAKVPMEQELLDHAASGGADGKYLLDQQQVWDTPPREIARDLDVDGTELGPLPTEPYCRHWWHCPTTERMPDYKPTVNQERHLGVNDTGGNVMFDMPEGSVMKQGCRWARGRVCDPKTEFRRNHGMGQKYRPRPRFDGQIRCDDVIQWIDFGKTA